MTNTSAAMVNRVRYFPYGGIRTQEFGGGQTTLLTDKLFTGQQRETTNEVYHYGARLYNADIGRMLSADTIVPEPGNPQALNRYSYVLNNPLRYTDPSGNCIPDMDGYRGCGTGPSGPPQCDMCHGYGSTNQTRVIVVSRSGGGYEVPAWILPLIAGTGATPWAGDEEAALIISGLALAGSAAWYYGGDDIAKEFGNLFSGGADPVYKGQSGVDEAIKALEEMGYDVKGKEVTFELPEGKRIRVDIWAQNPEGEDVAIEVKTGKAESLRTNPAQSEKYTELEEHGGVPRGERAREADLPEGEHVGDIEIEVVYVED